MPNTTRTTEEIRTELSDLTTRADALATHELAATDELSDAQATHGQLYASGANASTIKRQAAALMALHAELDGIARGRVLLAQQSESLAAELAAAEAREALQEAHTSISDAREVAATWVAYLRETFGDAGEFARVDAAVQAVGERCRAATSDAMYKNPEHATEIDGEYRQVWAAFPAKLHAAIAEFRASLASAE